MMHFVSDIHAELASAGRRWTPLANALSVKEDLILAGDVGNIEDGSWCDVVTTYHALVRKLYVVLGNHELYSKRRTDVETLVARARDEVKLLKNVEVLHRDVAVTPEGVAILGCMLWCNPMRARANGKKPDAVAMLTLLNDFKCIYVKHGSSSNASGRDSGDRVGPLTLTTMEQWHDEDVAWLTSTLASPALEGKRTLVVTHFAPLEQCNPPAYKDSDLVTYFCNDMTDVVTRPDAWIYGHVHGGADSFTLDRTLVARHCVGYPDEADSIHHIGMLHVPTSAHKERVVVVGGDISNFKRDTKERRDVLMERMGEAISNLADALEELDSEYAVYPKTVGPLLALVHVCRGTFEDAVTVDITGTDIDVTFSAQGLDIHASSAHEFALALYNVLED